MGRKNARRVGRRRLSAKDELAVWTEGRGPGRRGWQEGRAGQRGGGLHRAGTGLHAELTAFQTRERRASGRRGREETKETVKTVKGGAWTEVGRWRRKQGWGETRSRTKLSQRSGMASTGKEPEKEWLSLDA